MKIKQSWRQDLLRSLLAPLIKEWGVSGLRQSLLDLEASGAASGDEGTAAKAIVGVKAERLSAASLAAKADLTHDKKGMVVELAKKFDRKEFLPSAGHIRYFFEMNNAPPPIVKQRPEAFRKVLKLLSALSEESLLRLLGESEHNGPSEMGPISEAMRGVGERRAWRGSSVDMAPRVEEPTRSGKDADGEVKVVSDA